MRRAAGIFLAAILLPSLGLAWLAVHSAQDQQVVLQHQQAIIDQGVTDSLAQSVRTQMDGAQAEFAQAVKGMLDPGLSPEALAAGFDQKLRARWRLAQVGFAVDLNGRIYSPERSGDESARTFRKENDSFLSNRENAEVYFNANQNENPSRLVQSAGASDSFLPTAGADLQTKAVLSDEEPARDKNDLPAQAGRSQIQPVLSETTISASPDAAPSVSSVADKISETATPLPPERADKASAKKPPALQSTMTSPAGTSSADALTGSGKDEVEKQKMPSDAPAAASPPGKAASLDSDQSVAPQAPSATAPAPLSVKVPQDVFSRAMKTARQVAPQENVATQSSAISNVLSAQSDFRQLIGQASSGSAARFLDDRLCLLVWSRPALENPLVFGAQIGLEALVAKLRPLLIAPDSSTRNYLPAFASDDYCVALLDDKGKPVALSREGFKTDWKHPFVATEIGEVLPHWEAALYLVRPDAISHSARVERLEIGLIILLLVVAILVGGSLIGADVLRQMQLAQQKTDFVSNVSHELKTPLTSIRMFADMLAEGRIDEPQRQATYLRIISAESARLTRLINNVLDFARLERGAPEGERTACDLVEAACEVVHTCKPHLEGAEISLTLEVEEETLPLTGDRDALAQIILNLVSNAEKYGGKEIIVRARRQVVASGADGCVDVLDRGPGIPSRQVETIFAPFQRLNNSLASGVSGTGLGLTLARRMARAHGGDVTYQPRAGGGSCFTLTLPLNERKPIS